MVWLSVVLPGANYLESKRQREEDAADTHQHVTSCDEHFSAQTLNEQTL